MTEDYKCPLCGQEVGKSLSYHLEKNHGKMPAGKE